MVEWRFAEGKYDRLAEFAAEPVRMGVDVIVAFNTRGALEAKRATNTIPIVFASISDPVGSGLVADLAHPRSASYLDKIFRGAKAGDLPVEQPTRFCLVINRKTADALGLTIPRDLLVRADEVIQ